jgi:hypothetical protein
MVFHMLPSVLYLLADVSEHLFSSITMVEVNKAILFDYFDPDNGLKT